MTIIEAQIEIHTLRFRLEAAIKTIEALSELTHKGLQHPHGFAACDRPMCESARRLIAIHKMDTN